MTTYKQTVDKDEFLKRAQQHALQDVTAGDFFVFLLSPLVLLLIAAILFGVSYMISLGWHMGGS